MADNYDKKDFDPKAAAEARKKEMEEITDKLEKGYRFGERLSYNIDIEDGCEEYKVPKLTVVTFVENACVHGIESKSSPGWIFVRVFKGENELERKVKSREEKQAEADRQFELKQQKKKEKHRGR